MKKIISFLSVCTFLFAASWSFANEPAKTASSECHIQGSISSSSGTLLTNARAYIQNSSTSIQINRRNATFNAYVPSNSIVVFECDGHVSLETDPIITDQTSMSVVLQSSSSFSSAKLSEMNLLSEKVTKSGYTISGKVIDRNTGKALTNATWNFENSSESGSIPRTGSFTIQNVPANTIVTFSCNGFVSESTDPINSDQSNMSISLSPNSDYYMTPSFSEKELTSKAAYTNSVCQIKGKVINSSGLSLTQSTWRIENSSESNSVNRRDASFSGSVPFNSRIVFECSGYSPYTTEPITSDQSNLSITLTSESDFSTVVINLNLK